MTVILIIPLHVIIYQLKSHPDYVIIITSDNFDS